MFCFWERFFSLTFPQKKISLSDQNEHKSLPPFSFYLYICIKETLLTKNYQQLWQNLHFHRRWLLIARRHFQGLLARITKCSRESKKTESSPRRLVMEGVWLPHRTSPSTINPIPQLVADNVCDPMMCLARHNCHNLPAAKVSRIRLRHTGFNNIVFL